MNKNYEVKENFLASIKSDIKNIESFSTLPVELRKDVDFIIETLKVVKENQAYTGHYENCVNQIIKDLKIDKEVSLKLVKFHGFLVCRLPQVFKDDEDVMLAAINSYNYSLVYASKKMKDNKKIVLEAVSRRGDMLEVVSKRLIDDEEVVMAAVKNDGQAIGYAPKLWSNKAIMLEAVKTNMHALQYLGANLIGDKEIALEAYKGNKFSYEYFSKELKKEIIDNNIEDIAAYLESVILVKKLQKELSDSNSSVRKVKI
jgi:hypothetical protein